MKGAKGVCYATTINRLFPIAEHDENLHSGTTNSSPVPAGASKLFSGTQQLDPADLPTQPLCPRGPPGYSPAPSDPELHPPIYLDTILRIYVPIARSAALGHTGRTFDKPSMSVPPRPISPLAPPFSPLTPPLSPISNTNANVQGDPNTIPKFSSQEAPLVIRATSAFGPSIDELIAAEALLELGREERVFLEGWKVAG
ncbi:MAG: hypothetical protein Q9166_007901 [cf. Caloplaca sp. 2 TL-2023]